MRAFLAALIFCLLAVAPTRAYWTADLASPANASTHQHVAHHLAQGELRQAQRVQPWAWSVAPPRAIGRDISAIYERVTAAAYAAGVPVAIAHAVVRMESGYNMRARSASGAIGVMQVLPHTARSLGENPYDLDGNLRAGMCYLRLALDKGGAGCAGISLYNIGVAARPVCTGYGRRVLALASRS